MRGLIVACAISAVAAGFLSPPATAERIGTTSQPLIGDPVSEKQQRRLGLVTVDGGCSGTMLNQYWVLTADHCITYDGKRGSVSKKLEDLAVTAAWTDRTAHPTRLVRYWSSTGLDVALLRLDEHFGRMDRKLIYHDPVDPSVTLTAFGQGLCSLATEGPPAQPAEDDCGYRTAVFNPTRVHGLGIYFKPNSRRQMTMGGDSGGPAFVTDADGGLIAIAGVLATCMTSSVPGKEDVPGWTWVSGVSECGFSPLLRIRDEINAEISQAPPPPMADRRAPIDDDIMVSPNPGPVETRRPGRFGGIIRADGATSSPPPPPPPPQPAAERIATANGDVDIYDGPGRRGDVVIGMLRDGDSGAVIDQRSGWIKLRTNHVREGEGWVAEDHLSIAP